MIKREIRHKILELSLKFPVVLLTGARQTGKTTLLKSLFPDVPYINLEDLDNRRLATEDPRGFLKNFPKGAIIDEVQQVPSLFSYIQQIVDHSEVHYILSGSQNFQLMESITQSLAGRTAIFNLPTLSYSELIGHNFSFEKVEELIFKGGYPRIFHQHISPTDFYPNYISTYVERDVRQLINIQNLNQFSIFLKLCAGRIGQLINYQSLANDVGVSPNTVKSWLSILEASYIIYPFQPYYRNFNKRLIKSSKLYFYDTGLACSLLQLGSAEQVVSHYLKGGLFENFVINEMQKYYFNQGRKTSFYFWQDKTKKEIDVLIEKGTSLFPFEIKAAQTKNLSLMSNLHYWNGLHPTDTEFLNLIYAGDDNFKTTQGNFVSWRNLHTMLKDICPY